MALTEDWDAKISRRGFLRRLAGEGQAGDAEEDGRGKRVDAASDGEHADARGVDEAAALAALRGMGVSVSLLSGDREDFRVRARDLGADLTDEVMGALETLARRIRWLDVGSTGVSDRALTVVGRMPNLERLYLQHTRVTDAGLVHLSELPALEYLNLYGTDVSDDGLSHLKEISTLRSLFLWQTRVTADGVAQLVQALPDLDVELGVG